METKKGLVFRSNADRYTKIVVILALLLAAAVVFVFRVKIIYFSSVFVITLTCAISTPDGDAELGFEFALPPTYLLAAHHFSNIALCY